jgi:hypothetical protein
VALSTRVAAGSRPDDRCPVPTAGYIASPLASPVTRRRRRRARSAGLAPGIVLGTELERFPRIFFFPACASFYEEERRTGREGEARQGRWTGRNWKKRRRKKAALRVARLLIVIHSGPRAGRCMTGGAGGRVAAVL